MKGSVFTTPNQDWVLEFAIAHGEITTYADGRWGRHEYSRWPQAYARDCFHVACIPRNASLDGPSAFTFRTFGPEDWQVEHCGVRNVGFLKPEVLKPLELEATKAIQRLNSCRRDRREWNEVGRFLIVCLCQTLDRVRVLPAPQGVMISLAAHVQRLTLEVYGLRNLLDVMLQRLESQRDFSSDVLDVLGAHTPDPAVAQTLFRAGVPVWFQQPLTTCVAIYQVVPRTDVPAEFSFVPSYPRLVLAKRDISGILNTAGEWQRAMGAMVRRQLCSSKLPELDLPAQDDADHPSKRAREDASSANQWSQSVTTQSPRSASRPQSSAPTAQRSAPVFVPSPFRQYYSSHITSIAVAWTRALSDVGRLTQPARSVTYYYPPPWLLDSLNGFNTDAGRIARNMHHMVCIRTFCRLRLFDPTIAGRPLTISEWRDALWGDYHLDRPETGVAGVSAGRLAFRAKVRDNVRRLFGGVAALRPYDPHAKPELDGRVVTLEDAETDAELQRRLVWEAHEVNWRCELLSLDALMVGSNDWPELQRWVREMEVSRVWGYSTSGMDIAPHPNADMTKYCWLGPEDTGEDWEACRRHLQAFVDILVRWPGCPDELRHAPPSAAMTCPAQEYSRMMYAAVDFYVRTFVLKYQRLPVPPVRGIAPIYG
ncbi:hypothetical protein FKP32DRAFT_1574511 [Trametes sanguinea]|nr:hypothetical protein FKP32DRAFT_1574511 [Trametes sanguinea]